MRKGTRDRSLKPLIRAAKKEDLDALLNLEEICFKEERFFRKQLKYLLLRARSIVLVAEDGGVIGSILILLRENIHNARIYSLNVHPAHRRQGIASLLMDKTIGLLKEKGVTKITLEVGVNNKPAQNLYATKGFVVDKKLFNYYKNGDDALHLFRKL
ncbi:putative N-acetyltransferase [uncultured archaeon]|nr:putative N-acetyltransferase [uncultured archaeon]